MDRVITRVDNFQKILRDAKGSAVEDNPGGNIMIELNDLYLYVITFESPHREVLLPEDWGIKENNGFEYYLLVPKFPRWSPPFDHLVIFLHGLNEQRFDKIFPWAYNLTYHGTPTLLFPMSFHISRRPNGWTSKNSFNSKISERFIQRPERFFCGGLQTYLDLVHLTETITSLAPTPNNKGTEAYRGLFVEEPKIHFFGYSAGGYVALILSLVNPKGLFSQSKSLIFCSGAPLRYLNPATVYIVDEEAAQRLKSFYGGYTSSSSSSDHFRTQFDRGEEGFWFRSLFLNHDHGILYRKLVQLADRMLVVANVNDQVVLVEGVRSNLYPLHRVEMPLGIHEFPFTRIGYERNYRKALVEIMRNIDVIAPEYVSCFRRFMALARSFFRSEPGDFRFLELELARAGDRVWHIPGYPLPENG